MYFIIGVIIAVTIPAYKAQNSCPEAQAVGDFDLAKYAQGVWYEIGRSENNWESRGDCVTVTHEKQNDKVINFKIATILNHKVHNVEGTINLDADAKGTGIVDYISPAYTGSEGMNKVFVDITEIDYDKYAIVYHCHFDDKQKKLHQYMWILSRTKTLDDATQQRIKDSIKKSNLYDAEKITMDHFTKDICEVM